MRYIKNGMNWLEIVDESGLFWQYPVCTERQFCIQNDGEVGFVGFPWATIIDKGIRLDVVFQYLRERIDISLEHYTCCQHISFTRLCELFGALAIRKVYTPHKCLFEDNVGKIELRACPLFAVNIEDPKRNSAFLNKNPLSIKRDIYYSFMGGYQHGEYISDIRLKIFNLPTKPDVVIINTGGWHFNEIVYSDLQNIQGHLNESAIRRDYTSVYNNILIRSRYSLCPSGSGPNSIRFWESLGAGSIPILLADTLELPKNPMWNNSILRIKEGDLNRLSETLESISLAEEKRRRQNCIYLYDFYKNNYANSPPKESQS